MYGHGTRLITGYTNIPGSIFKLFAEKKLAFSLLVACICFSFTLHAQNTYYSRASTAFNTASTWSTSPTGTPQNGNAIANNDIFIIQSGHNVTVGASRTIAQITVNSGGTLTLGAFILTVTGNWTNNGTITGSTGRMNSTTGTLTNNGVISFSGAGGIIKTSGTLTNSATGSITVVGAGVITLGSGNFVNSNVLTPTAVNFGSSTISLTGTVAAQTIGGFSTTGQFLTTRGSGSVITLTGDIRCANISLTGNGAVLNLGAGLTHRLNGGVSLATGGIAGSDLAGGSSILYVYGGAGNAFTGTGVNFRADNSTVIFAGAAAQTLGGTGTGAKTFYNLTLDGANGKTNAGGITVNNILTYQGATSAIPSTTFTFGPNATLRYNSAVNRTTTTNEWPANIAGGTLGGGVLIENSGDITLNASKVLGLGIPVTIETSAVLSMGTNSLTVSSDISNNGGALNGTSATNGLVLTGTANQSIGAVSISGPVVAAKPSNTISVTGNITAGGLQVINTGTGLLDLGPSLTHSFGNFTGTSGSWGANSSLVTFSGSATHANATLVAGSSTISFTGAATQTVLPYMYHNLGLSGAGAKNILTGTAVTTTNDLTVNAPTTLAGTAGLTVTGNINGAGGLTMTSGTLRISGNWNHTGNFGAGTGTVIYQGGAQAVAGRGYNNLQISTAGVKTMATTSTVGGILTIHTPAELSLGAITLTLSASGTPLVNNGIFSPGLSTVRYSNASATTVTAADYYNLNTTGGGRILPSSGTIGILNTFTAGGGSFTVTGSTVDFKGAGLQVIPAFTFNKLIISNAGIKHIIASAVVNCQTIDIEDNASVEINADGGGKLNVMQ